MEPQKLIDIELLTSYRTANDDTKRMLEKIYGYNTFHLYNQQDEMVLLGSILKELMESKQEEVIYPYKWQDDEVRLICRLEIIKKTPIPMPPIPEEKKGNFEKLFERFKKMRKNFSNWP